MPPPAARPPTRLTPGERADALAKHEAMVWWVAHKTSGLFGGLPDDVVEDVAAAVRVQFLKASGTFDPTRGVAFGTYALRNSWRVARLAAVRATDHGLTVGSGPKVAVERPEVWSLDREMPYGGYRDGTWRETIPAPAGDDRPEIPADFWERIARVFPDRRWVDVLRMRFAEGLKLHEVGERLGVTRERVRQIEARACERVRKYLPELERYLD